jgi:hypothetical protein
MATADVPRKLTGDAAKTRDEWVARLSALVDSVEQWAQEDGWSTRRIEKQLEDSDIGTYQAPALLLQREFTKMLLEPIARSAPGAEGIVDLYRMPAYDDVASLYFHGGAWQLHHVRTSIPVERQVTLGSGRPLSKEAICDALQWLGNVK